MAIFVCVDVVRERAMQDFQEAGNWLSACIPYLWLEHDELKICLGCYRSLPIFVKILNSEGYIG